jgi:radical SAM superfamily enzyme YgiQ (UPF0313 family)
MARPTTSHDVLFLHVPKFRNYSKPIGNYSFILYPPIGLLGLAHLLTRNNYRARIVHLAVEQHVSGSVSIENILAEHNPAIVGLDLHWHFQSWDVIEVARQIKAIRSDVAILLGGFTASFFADQILLDHPCVDFIIRGDAEEPLLELVRCHSTGGPFDAIPNLSWRRSAEPAAEIVHNPLTYTADEAMLNSLCFTDFTLMKDYPTFIQSFSRYIHLNGVSERLQRLMFAKSSAWPVYIGRGCVHNCSYCGGSCEAQALIAHRQRIATRSIDAIVSSIEDLNRYRFDFACLPLDSFPLQRADETYSAIFDKVTHLQLPINLEVERYFLPTARFIRSFSHLPGKDSFITLSPHNPNEHLRSRNGLYRYSNAALENCLATLENHGVNTLLCFTCGLPFETEDDLEKMAAYQRRLRKTFKKVRFKNSMIEIEPASRMSRMPEHYGLHLERSAFSDYYRYHSQPGNDHWYALGYQRNGCPGNAQLRRFFCTHFCERFGANRASPFICIAVAALREAGAFRVLDKGLALVAGRSAPHLSA